MWCLDRVSTLRPSGAVGKEGCMRDRCPCAQYSKPRVRVVVICSCRWNQSHSPFTISQQLSYLPLQHGIDFGNAMPHIIFCVLVPFIIMFSSLFHGSGPMHTGLRAYVYAMCKKRIFDANFTLDVFTFMDNRLWDT